MQTGVQSECRVFALIIGIDQYQVYGHLNGCVNDANAFKNFLTGTLHVPKEHIEFITNESATRFNIISAFKKHLIENSAIRAYGDNEGEDTIIIFYAGHGSRVKAPDNSHSPDDYTVHNLLQQLAAAKGNNLTFICDACHSGGIGRKPELVPRFTETTVPIPFDLDSDLIGTRAAHASLPKGFRFPFMESHILLAACRQDQIAYEHNINGVCRGRFSQSLIGALQSISLEKNTYISLMNLVEKWVEQDPQVEGKHKSRFLFNRTYPSTSTKALPVTLTKSGSFEILMGSIEGVVYGTEFLVNDASNNTVAFLSAELVDLNRSVLVAKNRKEALSTFSSAWKATVSDWNNADMIMKVFLASDLDPTVIDALFPTRNLDISLMESLPAPRRFVPTNLKADGDVELQKLSDERFAIDGLRGIIRELDVPGTEFSLKPDEYSRLPIIMDGIAHFNYFLHKHHAGDSIHSVTLEMNALMADRRPSSDIFVDKIAHMQYDQNSRARYGFTLCNKSCHDFFPYLFYFDPTEYTIEAWYAPVAPTVKPPLARSPDGIQATRLPIGYGTGGYAFEFDLPAGTTVDTGFLKVFISTEYLDIGWIQQKSPFHPDFLASGRKWKRETLEKGQVWDAFTAAIIMRQK
ncbi:hypothetical protein MVEN_01983100 [Mycena venus]|uniref:Peptidase C14 caspase domain-containing protein n=1 Tax=Mycena venus TaxID=2733690 RepID=A0A8H6XEI1_9AGAR|nr:hypothetical protein MVEN_01983100 [Mycena venus]